MIVEGYVIFWVEIKVMINKLSCYHSYDEIILPSVMKGYDTK